MRNQPRFVKILLNPSKPGGRRHAHLGHGQDLLRAYSYRPQFWVGRGVLTIMSALIMVVSVVKVG